MRPVFFAILLISCFLPSCQKHVPNDLNNEIVEHIRINQLGYYPKAPKRLVLASEKVSVKDFEIVNAKTLKTVYTGVFSEPIQWPLAGETVRVGDFSIFEESGEYFIRIPDVGDSYNFQIRANLYEDPFKASIKSYYFQRASQALEMEHAGVYRRAKGHPDIDIRFHRSSGRSGKYQSPKGWYDAGDYGKYVINGAFSLGQMLMLYEQYTDSIGDDELSIPESGNGISDLLDELKYEMDWLLTMQDNDGGVWFKLTTLGFEGMIMPEEAISQRYIIGKGTASSLNFAAVAAKFSRIYSKIDQSYSEKLLKAAIDAWAWSIKNPQRQYINPEDVSTGEYGDSDFSQEFYWAAAELYLTSGDESYFQYLRANPVPLTIKPGDGWGSLMKFIGTIALIDHSPRSNFIDDLKEDIVLAADQLLDKTNNLDYFQPIDDFHWGSNSDVMNAGIILAQAYRFTEDIKYMDAVLSGTNYIFGTNATGYSFVSGFGSKRVMYLHHRPSVADGVTEPIPGFLSGGPNSRMQDADFAKYPENPAPMQAWVDQVPSYASNEVCLNWNAPLTYVLGFLQVEMSKR